MSDPKLYWNSLPEAQQSAYRQRALAAYRQARTRRGASRILRANGEAFYSRHLVDSAIAWAHENGVSLEFEAEQGGEGRDKGGSPAGVDFGDLKATLERLVADAVAKQAAPIAVSAAEDEQPADPVDVELKRLDGQRDRRRERDLVKQIASEKSFRAFLEDLMLEVAPTLDAPPKYKPPKLATDASEETILLVWSDWHAYEVIKPERTLDLNEYNAVVMAKRVKQIVLNSLSIKHRMERGGGWRFPRAVVACNGDFISGTIHEVERHSDAPSVIMAAYGTGLTLAAALRDLSPHFERIDVYCTPGNHGRLPDARRMQQKDPSRNWDTAIYLYAKTALSEVKNIHFHIPDSYVVMYEIGSRNFLQTHGHEIKSWNSIPFYGIDRYGRNVNALLTAKEKPVHFYIISHFHSSGGFPTGGGKSFINGSVIGGTEFSINALGKCDEPTQWMFGVDGKRITHQWEIEGNGDSGETYIPYPWETQE
jgi:hypothetical protein